MHILKRIPYWACLALLVYMPLHLFLAQSLSLMTGGLEVWKVAKDALLVVLCLFVICMVIWKRRGTRGFYVLLGFALLYAALHIIEWMQHPATLSDSALLGIIYNNRLFGYALLGMGAGLLIGFKERHVALVAKVVLGVSTAVALF